MLKKHGMYNVEEEDAIRSNLRNTIIELVDKQEKIHKWPIKEMFNDVYDDMPSNLNEQYKELMEHLKLYKEQYQFLTDKFSKEHEI